jgi:hypothetical protein
MPYVPFAMLIPHQHAHQLPDVQRIALGPTLATIDRNGGGIDYRVGEALGLQNTMQSEAFVACFVTADHRRGGAQTKARCGMSHCVEQAFEVTCRHGAFAWLYPMIKAEAELPGICTQLKGHKQHRLMGVIMLVLGRCGHHGLSPPW